MSARTSCAMCGHKVPGITVTRDDSEEARFLPVFAYCSWGCADRFARHCLRHELASLEAHRNTRKREREAARDATS